jgi:cell division protein FtsQ
VKRPQGFDTPPVRRTGERGSEPATRSDAASRRDPAADRVTTEPIQVVAPAARDRTGGLARPTPTSAAAPATTSTSTAPKDVRSARRAVAAAARARRRYERQEVRRFTKRSRRRRITWAVVSATLAGLVAVVAIGAYSPLMALRDVRIEGASRVPAAEVQAAFAEVMGTPLPLIDSAAVHDALSAFPLIETYSTETIPPGTLVVRIVERTPVGVIDTGDGLELVDAAGVVIERPDTRPEGQPLIQVEGGVAAEGFRAIAAVVRSVPPEVRAQLTAASAATTDDVQLELAGGARVVWGSAEDSTLKADVLATLMRAAPPDTVSLYDVSAPTSPVVMQ